MRIDSVCSYLVLILLLLASPAGAENVMDFNAASSTQGYEVTVDSSYSEQGIVVRQWWPGGNPPSDYPPARINDWNSSGSLALESPRLFGEIGVSGWLEFTLEDGSEFELQSIKLIDVYVGDSHSGSGVCDAWLQIGPDYREGPPAHFLRYGQYETEEELLEFPPGSHPPMTALYVSHIGLFDQGCETRVTLDDIVLNPVNCEVGNPNPPVADAGPDHSVAWYWGHTELQASSSDPDGNESLVDGFWTVESAPEGSNPEFKRSPGFTGRNPEFDPNAVFWVDTLGDYVLSWTAHDGCRSHRDFVTVHVYQEYALPEAVVKADVTNGPAPLTVQFDGSDSTVDPRLGYVAHIWDFGDGSPLAYNDAFPSHVYDAIGTYTVTLTVWDELSRPYGFDTDTIDITVADLNLPSTLDPTASPNTGPAPLVVQFMSAASDPESDPLTYFWDFGDPGSTDNTSTTADPAHVYHTPGTYTAWLTVSDGTNEVTESVAVVVTASEPLLTQRTSVERILRYGHNKGEINYWADINLPMPAPDDVIRLEFDGINLFNQPFSEFKPGSEQGVYVVTKRRLLVMIDFNDGLLHVANGKVNLNKFDNVGGVDIELKWGDETAVDQLTLVQVGEGSWYYERGTN